MFLITWARLNEMDRSKRLPTITKDYATPPSDNSAGLEMEIRSIFPNFTDSWSLIGYLLICFVVISFSPVSDWTGVNWSVENYWSSDIILSIGSSVHFPVSCAPKPDISHRSSNDQIFWNDLKNHRVFLSVLLSTLYYFHTWEILWNYRRSLTNQMCNLSMCNFEFTVDVLLHGNLALALIRAWIKGILFSAIYLVGNFVN